MSKCLCPCCVDTPGETYTEAHRHACEVRYLAGMATHRERAAHLRGVAKVRGAAAADRLRRDTWAAMQ